MYKRFLKRLIDIFTSGAGIIILSPFMLIIALAIWLDDFGPVIFKQKRIAKDSVSGEKQYFRIFKFRSMKKSAPDDRPTHLLETPEKYITKVGKFLRKTSLDELPQLFNILAGQMSVVGPRPALWNQDDLYEERAKYGANSITPGLSGWAQTEGRAELDIVEKARLDGEYCRNITFRMDATCFFMTIGIVLKRKGVIEGGSGSFKKHIEKRQLEIDEQEAGE